jgi:hypothetical protein
MHGFDWVSIVPPPMHVPNLHWFRRRQRAVARFVLAAFCLTWLQLAAMPCVMAMDSVSSAPSTTQSAALPMGAMPEGMVMAPGEHCMYCPPPDAPAPSQHASELCSFPHDPQVDSRAAFAATLLAPPPVVVLLVPHGAGQGADVSHQAATRPPRVGTPLAVSFCRFLK